jgi:5'-nucleotidase
VQYQHAHLSSFIDRGTLFDCRVRVRILITNDDGIYSPGIAALASAASRFGDVRIVAPDVEMSSAGHSITSSRPLSYRRTLVGSFDAYRVNGTPADCVALGMHNWEQVDVVLSGINLGFNLGNAMWHSGTLAGAKQGVLFGRRGIAVSAPATSEEPDLQGLIPSVEEVLRKLLPASDLPLVNVNLPARSPVGLCWTRQSVRHYDGEVIPGKDPMGRSHFWFVVKKLDEPDEGTDRWAVEHGYISMTPLRLDLTDTEQLAMAKVRMPLDETLPATTTDSKRDGD